MLVLPCKHIFRFSLFLQYNTPAITYIFHRLLISTTSCLINHPLSSPNPDHNCQNVKLRQSLKQYVLHFTHQHRHLSTTRPATLTCVTPFQTPNTLNRAATHHQTSSTASKATATLGRRTRHTLPNSSISSRGMVSSPSQATTGPKAHPTNPRARPIPPKALHIPPRAVVTTLLPDNSRATASPPPACLRVVTNTALRSVSTAPLLECHPDETKATVNLRCPNRHPPWARHKAQISTAVSPSMEANLKSVVNLARPPVPALVTFPNKLLARTCRARPTSFAKP